MTKPCTCDLCERHRRIRRIVAKGTRAKMRALILELEEDLALTGEDLDIKNAILDGSWPSARKYAERILRVVAAQEAGAPVAAVGGEE